MAFEVFRFMHAAGVLIDHQLRDIGSVDDTVRRTLLDATTTSFERIIEACVDHEADFLLLTGDTFADADRSVQARVAIRQGFECLAEAGIDVFVVPGPSDPAAAWSQIGGLPDNVTIFVPDVDEPTAVMKNGQVIATIQACLKRPAHESASDRDGGEALGHSRIAPFRIGIIPPFETDAALPGEKIASALLSTHRVDFLALPCPFPRMHVQRMEQVAHCPGRATSLDRNDRGPMGCSLIDVQGRGEVRVEQLVTSPVRRETVEIVLDDESTWDGLISEMRSAIGDLEAIDRVSVLILNWRIIGYGDVHDELVEPESESELLELLDADSSLDSRCHVLHRLLLTSGATDLPTAAENDDFGATNDAGQRPSRHTRDEQDRPFVSAFFRRLDREPSIVRSVLDRIRDRDRSESDLTAQLERLASRVDHRVAADTARRHGTAWFLSPATEPDDDAADDPRAIEHTAPAPHQVRRPDSSPLPGQAPSGQAGSPASRRDAQRDPDDDLPPPSRPVSEMGDFGTFT